MTLSTTILLFTSSAIWSLSQNMPSDEARVKQLPLQQQAQYLGLSGHNHKAYKLLYPNQNQTRMHDNLPTLSWSQFKKHLTKPEIKVLVLNEHHALHEPRWLLWKWLPSLKKLGFSSISFEAFAEKERAFLPRNGVYSTEPLFAALVRKAKKMRFKLYGHEPVAINKSDLPWSKKQRARKAAMAINLAHRVHALEVGEKLIAFVGHNHVYERHQNSKRTYTTKLLSELLGSAAQEKIVSVELSVVDPSQPTTRIFDVSQQPDLHTDFVVELAHINASYGARPELGEKWLPTSLAKCHGQMLVVAFRLSDNKHHLYDRSTMDCNYPEPLFLTSGTYRVEQYATDGKQLKQFTLHISN